MSGIMNIMQVFLGEVLYTLLVHPFFFVINTADNIFRALAGIDNSTVITGAGAANDGAVDLDGGVVYDLLKTDLIKKIFIAILVLAIFLLVIFTVMAFLRNVYAQKQKTSKEIISNSLKGLIYFIFVPVCTLLGVYLGNIVLRAVNGATSNAGAGGNSIVGTLFIAGAYDANQWRKGQELKPEDKTKLRNFAKNYDYKNLDAIDKAMTAEEFANVVDDVFASADEKESIYWHPHVAQYYDTWSFNFIIIIVGGCFVAYVMCSLAFAMARRIFIMLIWFVISPACCAMFPIDEGKMVGKYKDEMTKQVLSAYGAVAGVNLFLSVMPLIDNIQITNLAAGASGLVSLFIQICGLLCVKELVSALSSLVGGEDALAKGSSLMKSTTGAIKKYGGGALKKTVGTGTKVVSNFKRFGFAGKKSGLVTGVPTFFSNSGLGRTMGMGMNALSKGLLGIDIESDVVKTFRDTTKGEKEELRTARAKKVKKGYLTSAESKKFFDSKVNVENIDISALAKFISDGRNSGISEQDVFDELVEKKHIDIEQEQKLRLQLTEELDRIDKAKRVVAIEGPSKIGVVNQKAVSAAAAMDTVEQSGKDVEESKESVKNAMNDVSQKTNGASIIIQNVEAAISAGDINELRGSSVQLKSVKTSNAEEESAISAFSQKLETLVQKLEEQSQAQTTAKTRLDEFVVALQSVGETFATTKKLVEDFGNGTGKTSKDILNTAKEVSEKITKDEA